MYKLNIFDTTDLNKRQCDLGRPDRWYPYCFGVGRLHITIRTFNWDVHFNPSISLFSLALWEKPQWVRLKHNTKYSLPKHTPPPHYKLLDHFQGKMEVNFDSGVRYWPIVITDFRSSFFLVQAAFMRHLCVWRKWSWPLFSPTFSSFFLSTSSAFHPLRGNSLGWDFVSPYILA